MLGRRLRRRPNIRPSSGQHDPRLSFLGLSHLDTTWLSNPVAVIIYYTMIPSRSVIANPIHNAGIDFLSFQSTHIDMWDYMVKYIFPQSMPGFDDAY